MSDLAPYTPSPIVELAFVGRQSAYGPGAAQWHDISGDVYDARTYIGRSSEFASFNVGTLTLDLHNDDRKYDPSYSGSINPGFEGGNATIKLLAEFDAPAELYADTFDSALADWWSTVNGTTSISSGKLTGSGFCVASPMIDASRARVTVEIPTVAAGIGSTFVALASGVVDAHTDRSTFARVRITNGTIYFRTEAGGSSIEDSTTYNSTNHRWVRIEFTAADEIEYSISANGTSWTVAYTHTAADDATVFDNLPTHLRVVLEEAYASGAHAEFDNVTIDSYRLPVWYGYVDSFRLQYEEGGLASTCTVTAVDRLSYLADYTLPNTLREWLEAEYGTDLDDYWPMDTVAQDRPGGPKYLANTGFNATADWHALVPLEPADPLCTASTGAIKVPRLKPENGRKATPLVLTLPPDRDAAQGTSFAVSMWVQFPDYGGWGTAGTFDLWLSSSLPDGNLAFMALNMGITSSRMGGFVIDFEGDQLDTTEAGYLYDGLPHHVMFSRNGAELVVYLDGAALVYTYNAAATSNCYSYLEFLAIGPVGNSERETPEVIIDEVMIWRGYAPTPAEVESLYLAMTEGYLQPTGAGATISALLDTIGWSEDARAIDTGEVVVKLPGNLEGLNALSELNAIALAEGGRLFCDQLGRLCFHDRGRALRETRESTVRYSFTDTDRDATPIDVGIIEDSFKVALDDQFRITRAEVSREGGTAQVSTSSTDSRYTRTINGLPFINDFAALNLAEWLTFRYAASELRADEWQVNPETYTDDWQTVLGLGIGDRVDLSVTPANVGDPLTLDMILGLVRHDITPEEWLVSFHGTPTDTADYFLWDASETASDDHGWRDDTDDDPLGGAWG